jgi:hypothetical protein
MTPSVLSVDKCTGEQIRHAIMGMCCNSCCGLQAWGVLEHRAGNLERARELFQQGVWAQPGSKDVTYVWQAWGLLEAEAGHPQLARQLFKCAVKADPDSVPSWLVCPCSRCCVLSQQRKRKNKGCVCQQHARRVNVAGSSVRLSASP